MILTIYAMIDQKFVILTRNIKVQRPNILSWTSALRTSVADVICDGKFKFSRLRLIQRKRTPARKESCYFIEKRAYGSLFFEQKGIKTGGEKWKRVFFYA